MKLGNNCHCCTHGILSGVFPNSPDTIYKCGHPEFKGGDVCPFNTEPDAHEDATRQGIAGSKPTGGRFLK